jgi:hypothetical protein
MEYRRIQKVASEDVKFDLEDYVCDATVDYKVGVNQR